MTRQIRRATISAAMMLVLAIAGCGGSGGGPSLPDRQDERLSEITKATVEQQSDQNQRMAELSNAVVEERKALAEAAQELVNQGATARREIIVAQQKMASAQERLNAQLNEERASINAGFARLEEERKAIASQRLQDSRMAAAFREVGLIIGCLLPLFVCVVVIRAMRRENSDDDSVAEVLIHDLTAEHPRLLPAPLMQPALEHSADAERPHSGSE